MVSAPRVSGGCTSTGLDVSVMDEDAIGALWGVEVVMDSTWAGCDAEALDAARPAVFWGG